MSCFHFQVGGAVSPAVYRQRLLKTDGHQPRWTTMPRMVMMMTMMVKNGDDEDDYDEDSDDEDNDGDDDSS